MSNWMKTRKMIDTIISYKVHGLKPNTIHKLYILTYDISGACTPKGGSRGGQIITDAQGKCEFSLSLTALQNLQGVGAQARKHKWNLWGEIATEIEYSLYNNYSSKREYATFNALNYVYETVLKNSGGDSFAKGSFKFFEISTSEAYHTT